jgi:hypothetical protein
LGVLRRVLLAALLCLAAWAITDRVVTSSSEGAMASAGTASLLSEAPAGTEDSDRRWDAGHRTSASVTESVWRSQLHHSELASVSCPDRFDVIRRGDEPARRPRDASGRRYSLPLLI